MTRGRARRGPTLRRILVAGCAALALGAALLTLRPERVVVVRATRGPVVETIVVAGRLRPTARVPLAFESVGTVVSVAVSEGDRVRRGDVLARLDDVSRASEVDRARATLAEAEASVERLRGLRSRLAAVDERSARIALESARDRELRQRTLERGGATTEAEVADAVRAREAAEAAVTRAREQSNGLSRGGDDVLVATAQRDAARAALRSAQAAIDRTALRAPFDGIVLSRRVEVGQVVQPGATILELASDGPLEIVVTADETDLGHLAVGQRADASADSYPDRRFEAHVIAIAPSVDASRGTVEVRLGLVESPSFLRTDMTVSVEIETGRLADALLVPTDVVHQLSGPTPWVWSVRGGVVRRSNVRVGLRGDTHVAVTRGIDGTTEIVRGDVGDLSPGRHVRTRRER